MFEPRAQNEAEEVNLVNTSTQDAPKFGDMILKKATDSCLATCGQKVTEGGLVTGGKLRAAYGRSETVLAQ